jgi:hypothetical protein
MKTQTTSDPALSAIRTIRLAWLDEKLEAEARGDAAAAAEATLNLSACEVKLRELEKGLTARLTRSWASERPLSTAWYALRFRV